jgi:hypothetical protein
MSWLALIATTVISLCVLVAVPVAARIFVAIDQLLAAIARRQAMAMAAIIVVAIVLASIPTLIWSPPVPYVTDEFSYLLAADTLAHGRLSNPTPPMPEHFEFPNVLVRPTYASKYPLGQGAALALGQALFRLPIVGAWLTSALACVAIAWALRAVVPPKWALIGGLLAALHPLVEWWNNCYWGGNVAMLGGALLFGAILRALQVARFPDGVIAGPGGCGALWQIEASFQSLVLLH